MESKKKTERVTGKQVMDSIDCFDRYSNELGWSFVRTIPTAEFKAVLDLRLKIKDLDKSIASRYGLEDFDEWCRSEIKTFILPGTDIYSIENVYRRRLDYLTENLGSIEDVMAYSKLVKEEGEMLQKINRIIEQCKTNFPATVDGLSDDRMEKYHVLFEGMVLLFNEIKQKYGITKEEFYIWLRAKGVKGKSSGLFEVIPDLELYEIEFLRERLGDVEEVREYEKLATEYTELTAGDMQEQ